MSNQQGFIQAAGDPYVYQESIGAYTTSIASGINTASTGSWNLVVSSSTGAQPGSGFIAMAVDPVSGNVTLAPNGGGIIDLNGPVNIGSFFNAYGVVYWNGTILAATAVGTSGFVLTSNGAGMAPTFQSIASEPIAVTSVNHAASPYSVLSTDSFLAVDVSGGVVTVKLPNAPATGKVYRVKDTTGDAATNNITVTTVGGAVTIDSQTSVVMAVNYQSLCIIFDGTSYEIF